MFIFSEAVCTGIAFCGHDIQVASVVISSATKELATIESKITKLKNTNINTDHSIGFMFSCIGRGKHFHQQENVESKVFHKIFPETPLFGFFGNGEVGYDFLPDFSKEDQDKDYSVVGKYHNDPVDDNGYVWDLPDIHHSYATIFVLMSLPKS